ncbi:MAG: hypothetical protein AB1714_30895 [Acidobacteriota bacterium]
MKIQEQDVYHGPALMQIVEHPSFKALNRASKRYGHYLVNTDRQVFTKYRKTKRSPWQFVFAPDELSALAKAKSAGNRVFVCLVCGHTTICALNVDEFDQVIDVTAGSQQSIRVELPQGGSCRVSGSKGRLQRTVPHNSFPEKVFV